MKRFRSPGQVDSLPVTYPLRSHMKPSAGLPAPHFFATHGFHNHLLELTWIRYSFWHRKTPHFLVQVLYHTCLTNGVQFNVVSLFLVTRRGHLGPKSRRKRRLGLEIWHLRMPISPLRGSRPQSIKIRTQRMLCPYFGDPPGTRTPDLRLKRALLYQLS